MAVRPHFDVSRRHFLWQAGGGWAVWRFPVLGRQGLLGGAGTNMGFSGGLHHPPKAKRVIQLFMAGAASHVDLFDHKPQLEKLDGQPWDPGESVELFQSSPGNVFASPWSWKAHGQCGKRLSEIVSPLGHCVDDMAFVHNLVGKTGVHSQATFLQATGFQRPGFPGMGAWISYGLGSLNENLPTFVVMPDHRLCLQWPQELGRCFSANPSSGYRDLPQSGKAIHDLHAPSDAFVTPGGNRRPPLVERSQSGTSLTERRGPTAGGKNPVLRTGRTDATQCSRCH